MSHAQRGDPRPLFGRARDIAHLSSLLTTADGSPVTVCGASGVGKSALVRRVGHLVGDRFPRGIRVVDSLASLDDLPDMSRSPDTSEPPQALVILDSASSATPLGERGLADAYLHNGATQLLTCAIRPLGVAGERVLPVGPLPSPAVGDAPELMRANPAVELFYAQAAATGREPGETDLPAIAAICRGLGGWPRAIELAAQRTALLPPAVLARRLAADAARMSLNDGLQARGGSHSGVREMLAHTWCQLDADERTLIRAAAMFRGPFTVDQLGSAGGLDAIDSTLAGLVALHLIVPARADADADARFVASPLMGAYVRHTLRGAKVRAVRNRHASLVAGIAARARSRFDSGDERGGLRMLTEIDAELEPTLSALSARRDLDPALRLAADLMPMSVSTGRFRRLAARLDALLRRDNLPEGAALGAALVSYASLAVRSLVGQDVTDLTAARLRQGLTLTRRYGTVESLLRALGVAACSYPLLNDIDFAKQHAFGGLDLARREGTPHWQARFEAWLGMLHHQCEDIDAAMRYGIAALVRGRRCQDSRAHLLAGILLNTVPNPPADAPGGLPELDELSELAAELAETRLAGVVSVIAANRAAAAGDWTDAARWCVSALSPGGQAEHEADARFAPIDAVTVLMSVALGRDDPEQAAHLYGTILDRVPVLTANVAPHAAARFVALTDEVRGALAPETFRAAVHRGALLDWEQAVAAALDYAQSVVELPTSTKTRPHSGDARLTARETQVLRRIADGLDTKSIATELRVSANSVSHHTSNLLHKLGLANRTQAAVWAHQNAHILDH